MRLDAIRFSEAPGRGESLALTLMSLAAGHGAAIDYDDLCMALGLSCTAVSTTAEDAPGWWTTYGRDVFLEPAARLFGFELRDLHPPGVAIDMLAADEFSQHWEVSYKPLIRAALANAQPVLAWQGWPEHHRPHWGVITAPAGDDFLGWTLGSDIALVLAQPALQCYVVESFEPSLAGPPRDRLLCAALHHTDAYMNAAPLAPCVTGPAAPPVVTGPAAFDAWEAWLEKDARQTRDAWNEHRQHAEFIAAGHSSAAVFLRRMHGVAPPESRDGVQEAARRCELVASLLEDARDPVRVESLFCKRAGRVQLLDQVRAAEAQNRLLADVIHALAGQIGAKAGPA